MGWTLSLSKGRGCGAKAEVTSGFVSTSSTNLEGPTFFPIFAAAGDDTKQWVRPRAFDLAQLPVSIRVAHDELRQQMLPLVIELPAGHAQVAGITGAADFGRVEAVPACE